MRLFVAQPRPDHTTEASNGLQHCFARNRSMSHLAFLSHKNFWCYLYRTDIRFTTTVHWGDMIHGTHRCFRLCQFGQHHQQHVNITLMVALRPAAPSPPSTKSQQQQHLYWVHLHKDFLITSQYHLEPKHPRLLIQQQCSPLQDVSPPATENTTPSITRTSATPPNNSGELLLRQVRYGTTELSYKYLQRFTGHIHTCRHDIIANCNQTHHQLFGAYTKSSKICSCPQNFKHIMDQPRTAYNNKTYLHPKK